MLSIKQEKPTGITYFPMPKRYNTGWRVEVIRDGKVKLTRYALSEKDAKKIRISLINKFWYNSLN